MPESVANGVPPRQAFPLLAVVGAGAGSAKGGALLPPLPPRDTGNVRVWGVALGVLRLRKLGGGVCENTIGGPSSNSQAIGQKLRAAEQATPERGPGRVCCCRGLVGQ